MASVKEPAAPPAGFRWSRRPGGGAAVRA